MLTPLQAQDQYIFDSVAQFLTRTVKSDYDPVALATATATDPRMQYPKALTIREGKPDDITIVRLAPSIAISMMPAGESNPVLELGNSAMWRPRSFLLSCYPSLDGNGEPCSVAAKLLRSYVSDALESECIRIIDYSNPSCSPTNVLYTSDVIYIRKRSAPIDRGRVTALAEEKHRFDVHFNIEYAVQSQLRT